MKSFLRKLSFLIIPILSINPLLAQVEEPGDFSEIFKGAPEDAATYLQSYIGPAMLSFSNGMAGGWVNTAKTHKSFGLDLSFSLNVANMPLSERVFTLNPADFNLLRVQGGSGSGELPTLVGGTTSTFLEAQTGVPVTVNGTTYQYNTIETFKAPDGFDLDDVPFVGVPVPTLQLGIGLFKNTDLKLRFVPEQNFDDYGFKLFGFGIQHDIKQWIPGIKQLPLDVAIFFGTTKVDAEYAFEAGDPQGISDDFYVTNGLAEFEARATTFQAIVSKKLSFFTPYLSIGYNSVSSNFTVNGDYTLFDLLEVGTSNVFQYNTVSGNEDPVVLNFSGGGGARTTVGFRLKLFILTIHTDYTFQKYNTFTLGFGFTFREN